MVLEVVTDFTEVSEVTEAVGFTEVTEAVDSTEVLEVTEAVDFTEVSEVTEDVDSTEVSEVTEAVGSTEVLEVTEDVDSTEVSEAGVVLELVDGVQGSRTPGLTTVHMATETAEATGDVGKLTFLEHSMLNDDANLTAK
jgi:hypothetical protein